ncbi:DUF732 domain-containing protein [[Mycobacterium] wendilense]|uniref:DUF732 domain-containing protein n=1 Tax=[Mycobacterium] wendilense TaxID=3064284 RepID=A0ABN9NZL0_9MYCO|nr:DUF732 domain-containing protein [Mycolicibacterium sp. MU0050]CAJ1580765.1 DUF732 domain-containing protein [Mycolicibacterium sp. MU0050]
MKYSRMAAVASVAASIALSVGVATAVPALADPQTDAFVDSLADAGITGLDPATAAEVGHQVCPMLAEPGQQMADVAGRVSESLGRPLGPATMFTGLAITLFCPGAVASVANGESPIPLGLFGF